ncbi:DUF924 family protein [Aurantiacibacter gangjinensis]|uniref:DUF924 family protein n=1 Tax=Aurantiacibacter gangjinensis TaxID=502682 RepID=UPI00069C5485|nr:DUF924 family protein [Aurantiacibacter gangjinensis]
MLALRPWAAEILYVWFHKLGPSDWWGGNEHVDSMLRRRFAREWAMLSVRPPGEFTGDAQMALAAVLLFDQVPRNIFRDDPRAYATDGLARMICNSAFDQGYDRALTGPQAQFLAMPLMHSEDIIDQRRALRVFAHVDGGSAFSHARSHHRMIAHFGRFPHRNEVLGRTSTEAEQRAIEAGFAW